MPSLGKCLALVFSFLILGQAYLVRKYVGTWLFPACLFGLFWFGFSFIPLVVLLAVPISPWGTGFILLSLAVFSSSSLFFPWSEAYKKNVLKAEAARLVYGSPFLRKTFYTLTAATVVCIVVDSISQGATFHDLVFDLIATAASYRDMASFDTLNSTIWGRLSEIMIYAVAVLGGLLISTASTKWNRFRIIVFSFVPGVLLAVAHSTKWALFSCIAFFYAGLLAYRASQGDFSLFRRGSLKKLVLCVAALVLVTTASFMSRGLQDSEDTYTIQNRMRLMFASYSSGHLYAYSDWCAFYMADHFGTRYHSDMTYSRERAATYGLYTFGPLLHLAGSGRVLIQGVYDDYYEYGDILKSNVYTMFRGLIEDFGLFGSLLFMFLFGVLLHWAFYRMLCNRSPVFTVAIFIFSVDFFYSSFGRSLFTWSGMYFTFALICAIFAIDKWITQRNGGRLAVVGMADRAVVRP